MKKIFKIWFFCTAVLMLSGCEQTRPDISFRMSSGDVEVGERVFFYNETKDATSYKWFFGDGEISRESEPEHAYQSAGEYFITLIAYNDKAKSVAYASIRVGQGSSPGVFNLVFTNSVFTPILVEVDGAAKTVGPEESTTFTFDENPGIIEYYAETQGARNDGDPVGELVFWEDNNVEVFGMEEKSIELITSNSLFYIYMQNNSAFNLSPIEVYSVMEGYYFEESLWIPNDGELYRLGYYKSHPDIAINAYYEGFSNGLLWDRGDEFDLPMTENQFVILYSGDAWVFSAGLQTPDVSGLDVRSASATGFYNPVAKTRDDDVEISIGKIRE